MGIEFTFCFRIILFVYMTNIMIHYGMDVSSMAILMCRPPAK